MPGAVIYLVDDDLEFRSLVGEYLGSLGYAVREFASAEGAPEALEAETASGPRLVLSDTRMARMTGFELAARLRRRWPELPIVLMSAFGTRQIEEEALANGATAYLDKPFPLSRVRDLIQSLVRSE
jgi:CheY-like chemotaxis protein